MSAQKKPTTDEQEPSMEEILSSIKRIIADDEEPNSAAVDGEAPKVNVASEDEGVLELTEVVPETKKNGKVSKKKEDAKAEAKVEMAEESETVPPADDDDVAFEEEIAFEADFDHDKTEVESDKPLNGKGARGMDEAVENGLLSADAAVASTNAFSKLTKAVQGRDDNESLKSGGTTIESLVAELLRPSLKEWLDGNLEHIVQNVVEHEVKKLARRAELL